MQYRLDKKGNKVSQLAFGCMRFQKNGAKIDIDEAEREVMEAIKQDIGEHQLLMNGIM